MATEFGGRYDEVKSTFLEVVDYVSVCDTEPEIFAVDRSTGKLVKHFCQVKKVPIVFGSLGGGNS